MRPPAEGLREHSAITARCRRQTMSAVEQHRNMPPHRELLAQQSRHDRRQPTRRRWFSATPASSSCSDSSADERAGSRHCHQAAETDALVTGQRGEKRHLMGCTIVETLPGGLHCYGRHSQRMSLSGR